MRCIFLSGHVSHLRLRAAYYRVEASRITVMQHYPKQSPVPGIGCPKYQPCASNQRCQYCLGDRACALATKFRCVEPLRRNGLPYWQGAPA
jgi:hypothetical protein